MIDFEGSRRGHRPRVSRV